MIPGPKSSLPEELSADPENWDLRLQAARALADQGDPSGAAQLVVEASTLPLAEEQLADAYELSMAEAPAEMRSITEKFLQSSPESATAHMVCAQLASQVDDPEGATHHYDSAISLNPDYRDEEMEAWIAQHASGETPAPLPVPLPAVAVPFPAVSTPAPAVPLPAISTPVPVPVPAPAPPPEPEAVAPDNDDEVLPLTPVKLTKTPPPPPLERHETPDIEEIQQEALDATGLVTASPFDHIEIIRTDERPADTRDKASAIGIAVLIHALIFFILTLIVIAVPRVPPPQIRAIAASNTDVPPDPTKKEVQKMAKPNPSSASRMNVISVANTSAVSVPVVIDPIDSLEPIGVGSDFGMQMSFGSEGAGNVSFFGSQSAAQKVVFVVDASASMSSKVQGSNIDKFALMQQELTKSIKQLPPGIDYQVIFFAGPCWYAGDEIERSKEKEDGNLGQLVTASDKKEHFWYEGPYPKNRNPNGGTALYHYEDEDDDKLPSADWIASSKANIHKTSKHIEETPKIFGTDWRWPLRMAMNMEPDVIYFMTDGAFGLKGEDVVGDVISYNRRKSRAKINTICLMELKAYEELQEMADKSSGEFTLVLFDGTTLHGKDIEEWIKDNPGLAEGKK
jgi:hypothetical protein